MRRSISAQFPTSSKKISCGLPSRLRIRPSIGPTTPTLTTSPASGMYQNQFAPDVVCRMSVAPSSLPSSRSAPRKCV